MERLEGKTYCAFVSSYFHTSPVVYLFGLFANFYASSRPRVTFTSIRTSQKHGAPEGTSAQCPSVLCVMGLFLRKRVNQGYF